eukprot:TRINITY_DN35125_c0_g1_i1.p1 TRINITY_DN35125_c0_g1~~TRINITY_DN35125_c0_g1_i1.p1  ORF type:complete len:393 (+),score=57.72 TRINITY_DN35125_c0_g1_i1:87-1265(+)
MLKAMLCLFLWILAIHVTASHDISLDSQTQDVSAGRVQQAAGYGAGDREGASSDNILDSQTQGVSAAGRLQHAAGYGDGDGGGASFDRSLDSQISIGGVQRAAGHDAGDGEDDSREVICKDGTLTKGCETSEEAVGAIANAAMLLEMLSLAALAPVLIILIVQCGFACLYQQQVTQRRPPFPDQASPHLPKDFTVPLCSCCDDCDACLHGFFCHTCRAADTYAAANIISYWQVIAFSVAAPIVAGFIAYLATSVFIALGFSKKAASANSHPTILCAIINGLFYAGLRQKLRRALGGHVPRDVGDAMVDFITWCLLPCCATVQEARQVDAVQGVRVSCCCKLTVVGHPLGQPLVGLPVAATSNIIMAQDNNNNSFSSPSAIAASFHTDQDVAE